MIASVLKFIFGTANQKNIKKLQLIVNKINEYEKDVQILDENQIIDKTNYFKQRVSNGESLDSILPEAFALVREVSKRKLNQRHYDVQLMGGIVLHQGKISEMKTGEGKTLTATLPLYLNSLTGKGSHLITVNDYLAKRDSDWMREIYNSLGLSVGALQNDMYDSDRKSIYECDIVYGTNSEFGFDYLRDNMKFRLSDYVQRDLNFAIVDEVDSILIDEARTPLIISGASESENIELCKKVDKAIKSLKAGIDYEVDEKERNSSLTDLGVDKVEGYLEINNLFAVENIKFLHYVTQALRANTLFKKDFDYVVWKDEVLIVDEFTGRILAGRRYSDGLHQAIEAKENVEIQKETQTLASITLQNYFRLYKKLAGMTGTALTEAEEFHKIYNLDVVSIPTNKIMKRIDKPDFIFLTERSKFKNIVTDIKERYKIGQPVLIGTVAIETSEKLSEELSKNGIPHEVLNAKQHEREADIIAHAGEKGKITIATNMAGRGTDIKLTDEAKEAGGLYILGTERHENRRIDNQLRGRSGRQGDAGESRFYISLEDSLIRRFGRDSIQKAMEWVGMKEDEVIEDEMISNSVETAQEKVEKQNFEVRKQLIEYDDVLNQQRIIIYGLRRSIITGGKSLLETLKDIFEKFVSIKINNITNDEKEELTIDKATLIINEISKILSLEEEDIKNMISLINPKHVIQFRIDISNYIYNFYLKSTFSENFLNMINKISDIGIDFEDVDDKSELDEDLKKNKYILISQKWFALEIIDYAWRQHIVNLDHIREGIGLRGYGQKTPLIEYKNEAFHLFKRMTEGIIEEIISKITKININDFNAAILEQKRISEMNEIEESLHKEDEEVEEKPKEMNRKQRRASKKGK